MTKPAVGQIWRVINPKGTLARIGDQARVIRVSENDYGQPVAVGYSYVDGERRGVADINSFSARFAPVGGSQ